MIFFTFQISILTTVEIEGLDLCSGIALDQVPLAGYVSPVGQGKDLSTQLNTVVPLVGYNTHLHRVHMQIAKRERGGREGERERSISDNACVIWWEYVCTHTFTLPYHAMILSYRGCNEIIHWSLVIFINMLSELPSQ